MNNKKLLALVAIIAAVLIGAFLYSQVETAHERKVQGMVEDMARAWETGDEILLDSILHEDSVFAYPGRRLSKEETLEDLRFFADAYTDTKVYIHTVVVTGNDVAVEWQFATTKEETGKREVVSDAIIGKIKDGKFIVWKEYLDGRVKGMQAEGTLELEEGMEPFPWPERIEIRAS